MIVTCTVNSLKKDAFTYECQYESKLNRYFICTVKPKQIHLLSYIYLDFLFGIYFIDTSILSIINQIKSLLKLYGEVVG
jgi:hypothetical protein